MPIDPVRTLMLFLSPGPSAALVFSIDLQRDTAKQLITLPAPHQFRPASLRPCSSTEKERGAPGIRKR
jgi:hypothetical protein